MVEYQLEVLSLVTMRTKHRAFQEGLQKYIKYLYELKNFNKSITTEIYGINGIKLCFNFFNSKVKLFLGNDNYDARSYSIRIIARYVPQTVKICMFPGSKNLHFPCFNVNENVKSVCTCLLFPLL